MATRHHHHDGEHHFLDTSQLNMWRHWAARALALVCTITLTLGGLQLLHNRTTTHPPAPSATATTAPQFARDAAAAFQQSANTTGADLSPTQRRAGLPTQAVDGLNSPTIAGTVQQVLPAGLGAAIPTPDGQVVYPDAGAGFDMLAENTPTGIRTVARIPGPHSVRMITTFIRTPADTVMLAHTNGYLTINRATRMWFPRDRGGISYKE